MSNTNVSLPVQTDEPYVVRERGEAYVKPRTVINAISEIQRFYVIESKSELPREFFTIEQVIDFFKLGFWTGFLESILFVFIFVFLQLFYPPLKYHYFNSEINAYEIMLLSFTSYIPILISTIFMFYISRYYRGKFTKRAITSLLNGRSLSFIAKALIVFICFRLLINYSASNPDGVWSAFDFVVGLVKLLYYNINTNEVVKFYYDHIYLSLNKICEEVVITMIISAVIPYTTILFRMIKQVIKEEKTKFELKDYN